MTIKQMSKSEKNEINENSSSWCSRCTDNMICVMFHLGVGLLLFEKHCSAFNNEASNPVDRSLTCLSFLVRSSYHVLSFFALNFLYCTLIASLPGILLRLLLYICICFFSCRVYAMVYDKLFKMSCFLLLALNLDQLINMNSRVRSNNDIVWLYDYQSFRIKNTFQKLYRVYNYIYKASE